MDGVGDGHHKQSGMSALTAHCRDGITNRYKLLYRCRFRRKYKTQVYIKGHQNESKRGIKQQIFLPRYIQANRDKSNSKPRPRKNSDMAPATNVVRSKVKSHHSA